MRSPLVSVVIPTYNQQALLRETLQSVFAQTFTDYEVVVVNDGSTDGTSEYLRSLGKRIRLVEQGNQGIGAARNRGIDEATGKYVALLDHDDLWKPGKLEAQVLFMESHPECTACSVPWARSTASTRCVFDSDAIRSNDGLVERPLWRLSQGHQFLISSSIMFERQRAGGLRYGTRRQCIEDDPFQIGLFSRGPFGIAGNDILMIYRWHGGNSSAHAIHFYNGVRLLRTMQRAGNFSLDPIQAHDLERFLSFLGRTAVVRQLLGGYRGRALDLYVREFLRQTVDARFRFLLAFPVLALLPSGILHGRWKGDVK